MAKLKAAAADTEPMDWMTRQEVADYLRVSTRHLQTLDIPRTKVGRLPRFSRRAVDAWLLQHSTTPNEKPRRHSTPGADFKRPPRFPRRPKRSQTAAEFDARLREIARRPPPAS